MVDLGEFVFCFGEGLGVCGIDDEHENVSDGIEVFPCDLCFATHFENH